MRIFYLFFALFSVFYAKDISICSYNVENLFDAYRQGSEYADFTPRRGWDKKTAQIKLSHTLKVIRYIDADIIALQEVENRMLLKKLAKLSGYRYFEFAKPNGSPIGLGVMSRYPIKSSKQIYSGIRKTRDFLRVNIDINGDDLTLFVVHFPTKKYPISKRLKVAKTLKKEVDKLGKKEILILGDFNTNISKHSILQRSFGDLSDKNGFYDPWFSVAYKERFSEVYKRHKSALDRILLSETLFNAKSLEYVKGSFKVLKGGFLSDKNGYPKRWRVIKKPNANGFDAVGYSDHFPILLRVKKADTKKTYEAKSVSISELLKLKDGKVNVRLNGVKVIYKNRKNSVIFHKNQKGVFVYRANDRLEIGDHLDVLITQIGTYKGSKEILSYEVLKRYPKVQNIQKYMQRSIQHAKANDVIFEISGKVKGRYFLYKNGKMLLYNRMKMKLHDGKELTLRGIRVGKYRGKLELILEKKVQ